MDKENKAGRQPQDYWTDNDESSDSDTEYKSMAENVFIFRKEEGPVLIDYLSEEALKQRRSR